MQKIKFIVVGALDESYWREAAGEYIKRMGAAFSVSEAQLKPSRLPKNPSDAEIKAALEAEARMIERELPARAYKVAMCVEGRQLASPGLAELLARNAAGGIAETCFIIGSSHGLAEGIKAAADMKLSMSALTFPHQLARVMLYEAVYRAGEIMRGTKYHK